MGISLHIHPTGTADEAGAHLAEIMKEYRDTPTLLLLSGGSAFDVLDAVDADALGDHVQISMLDDRFTTDPENNNFSRLMHLPFLDLAQQQGCYIYGTQVQHGETLTGLCERYERMLREWRRNNPNGKIVATMGIGADGHTAGIMPYPESRQIYADMFQQPDDFAVGYDAGEKSEHPLRVTVTDTFLREQVDDAVLYAVGRDKQDALARVFSSEEDCHEVPARVIHHMKHVEVYTKQPTEPGKPSS